MSLLTVEAAQARVLALGMPLPSVQAPLVEAVGRVLSADVEARRTQPAADLSAMDGYAIRFADLPGPWHIVGESAAGRALDRAIGRREAARIFTGAPLPAGADTIVIQEHVVREDDRVLLTGAGPAARGASVRPQGLECRAGDPLGHRGDIITAQRIALLAAGGHGTAPVRRKANVVLIATGDELVAAGLPTRGAQLPSSNTPMLAARLSRWPVRITDHGIVRDDAASLAEAFAGAADPDLILTTGGVSVGDHDHVAAALAAAGARIEFWRVAIKPGKPLLAGRLGQAVVLALPGNPVSAFVTALLFAEPLLARLTGSEHLLPRPCRAPLAGPLAATGERTEYLRARLTSGVLVVTGQQDSGGVKALADADALVVRQPRSVPAAAGDSAEFLPLG